MLIAGMIRFAYEDSEGTNPYGLVGELTFDIEYRCRPAEPMVMYYPDGSGYPGSPAEIEYGVVTPISYSDGEKETSFNYEEKLLLTTWFSNLIETEFIQRQLDEKVQEATIDIQHED